MKYLVSAVMTVSCWTEVEADSFDEAIEIASGRSVAEHHIDGGQLESECWVFDNDGEPTEYLVAPK